MSGGDCDGCQAGGWGVLCHGLLSLAVCCLKQACLMPFAFAIFATFLARSSISTLSTLLNYNNPQNTKQQPTTTMNDEDPESLISPSSSHSLPASAATAGKAPARPAAAANQMAKLREANAKYKNLLKMAKERIQEQEGVLEERRCEFYFEGLVELC